MAVRLLPGFRTLSEFGKYHGDCFWCALLGILHTLDPVRWPLTLSALDRLTADAIAKGYADAKLSGGVNIPNASAYLTDVLRLPHTVYCSYAPPRPGKQYAPFRPYSEAQFHAHLKELAGVKGIVAEWGRGGALPGDEPAVQFHYSSCGGIDTGPAGDGIGGGYLWCDGDNRASPKADGGGPPLLYSWPQIVPAQCIGYIIVDAGPAGAGVPAQGGSAVAFVNGVDSKGHHCGPGMQAKITELRLAGDGYADECYDVPPALAAQGVRSFLALTSGEVLTWRGGADVRTTDAGLVVDQLYRAWKAEQQRPSQIIQQVSDPKADAAKAAIQAWLA